MKYAVLAICLLGCASVGFSAKCDAFLQEMYERGLNVAQDICHNKFAPHVQCLAGEVENSVNNVIAESDLKAQSDAKQCFGQAGCNNVDYTKEKALNAFLPCAYTDPEDVRDNCVFRYVADRIIEALEETPKKVGKCMVKFFKGVGQRKIEDCTRQYPPEIKPEFHMPEIPGFDEFELEDLKNVLLYHVMTRYHLGKCTQCSSTGPANNRLIGCLADQTKDEAQNTCQSRQKCEGPVLQSSCKDRYQDTRSSICTCFGSELKKGLQALQDWGEMKQLFVRGDFDCQLSECYTQEGIPEYKWKKMENLLKQIKRSAISAIAKLQFGKAPPQVAEALVVFKNILEELVSKWGGLYCGTCDQGRGSPKQLRRESYVNLLNSEGCANAQAEFDLSRPDELLAAPTDEEADKINDFFG